jgi:hypothetical protein
MSEVVDSNQPIAFLSYSHFDDQNEGGRLTEFRELLESELRARSGKTIVVFQDRAGIDWGESWRQRVESANDSATFFLPIITPSFFTSDECQKELERFVRREQTLGRNDLILPIYYIDCEGIPGFDSLKTRQYKDWRDLRGMSPKSRKVLKALAEVAQGLLSALSRAAAPPRPQTSPQQPKQKSTDQALIAAILSRDPLVALPASQELRSRPDLFPAAFDAGPAGDVSLYAVRSAFAAHPAATGEMLLDILGKTEVAGEAWDRASRAASLLSGAHSFCAGQLLTWLEGSSIFRELRHLSLRALGRCAGSTFAYGIVRAFDWDEIDNRRRFGSTTAEALAGIMVRTDGGFRDAEHVAGAFMEFAGELGAAEREVIETFSTRYLLSACDGRHADAIISEWLPSPTSLCDVGADVLGDCRIRRAVPPLLRLLESLENQSAVGSCSSALGQIGTPEAIAYLISHHGTAHGRGLIFALDRVEDSKAIRNVLDASAGSTMRFLALRAVGLRAVTELVPVLRDSLNAPAPEERGSAALALARLGAIDLAGARLVLRQAADHTERIFAALAVLTLAPDAYPDLEQRLRQDLATDSYFYWTALLQDIVDVLQKTGRPDARALADAWRPFYHLHELE